MAGMGLQPMGTSSSGFGTSDEAPAEAGAFLRDTKTGNSFGVRQIDPNTRDYVIDANGRTLGLSYVKHAVQMSVHTRRGSAVVQSMGHRLGTLDRITPNFEKRVLAVLTEAVQPLIDLGYIEVIGFSSFVAGDYKNGLPRGAVYGRFQWRDLTTAEKQEELI